MNIILHESTQEMQIDQWNYITYYQDFPIDFHMLHSELYPSLKIPGAEIG